ncbi:hypothetical protein BJX70DRAFT_368412 [Aspergillus crustosus]
MHSEASADTKKSQSSGSLGRVGTTPALLCIAVFCMSTKVAVPARRVRRICPGVGVT